MKLLLVLSWLLLGWLPGSRQQVLTSEISFQITNAGLAVEGTLSGLEATVQFDPAHLAQASIRASVPVSTVQTGIALRDRHLQKPDYFDAEKYPLITLQSTAIRQTGAMQYEGTFTLTMKGISHEVKLPFTVSPAHELKGQLLLNRLDYHLGKSSIILSDQVKVNIRLKLDR